MPAFLSVVFDCDSTLSAIEGIDELAGAWRAESEALTDAAMRGELPLEAVYGQRLALIRPTRAQVDRVGRMYVERLVDGAHETVRALHTAGIEVRIVSGGVRPAVLEVGRALGIADTRVFAVDLHFDDAGEYVSWDDSSPLARSGGKAALIRSWGALPRPSMLVGDGATDLEAKDAVDCFVAFAGVAHRPHVIAAADVVVRAPSLLPVLALALGDEPPTDRGSRALYDRGRALLA